jgi:hypothetical protein
MVGADLEQGKVAQGAPMFMRFDKGFGKQTKPALLDIGDGLPGRGDQRPGKYECRPVYVDDPIVVMHPARSDEQGHFIKVAAAERCTVVTTLSYKYIEVPMARIVDGKMLPGSAGVELIELFQGYCLDHGTKIVIARPGAK